MADFCKSCSYDMWGGDSKDLSDLITKEQFESGTAAVVICEGCCASFVDHEGNRVKESLDGKTWEKY